MGSSQSLVPKEEKNTRSIQGFSSKNRKEGVGSGCVSCKFKGKYYLRGRCVTCKGLGRYTGPGERYISCPVCNGQGETWLYGKYYRCNFC